MYLKSEEIPSDNSGNVKIVVGKTFDSIVIDNEKDVLIEFYAPWCNHCNKLQPIWDEVATTLRDVPNFVIAKMDLTINEVKGLEVKGYPTIKFYPKGLKQEPINYDGGREAVDIINFLKSNSVAYKKHSQSKNEL